MRINLSKKIIITIEVIVLITVILLGVVFFIFLKNNTKNEINTRLTSISYLKGNYLKQYIDFNISETEISLNSSHVKKEFINLLNKKSKDSGSMAINLLADGMIDKTQLIDLSIINNDGVVVASSNQQDVGKIKSDESYFIEGKNSTTFKSFVYDSTYKKIIIIIAAPIKDDKNKQIGVFVEKLDTKNISLLMSDRLGLGSTGETFLINKSHVVTTSLLKEEDTILRKTLYLPQVNSCLNSNTNYYLLNDYHGDKVFGYARWVPEMDSCLVTKIDYIESMDPIFNLIPKILSLFVVISFFVLFIGYFIGESITKPLIILRNQAIKIKEGDMDVIIESKSNDEVGDVAISFREMLEKLKELYKNLEEKVRKRTEDLEMSEKKLKESLELSEKNNKMMINRELEMIKLKDNIKELEEKIKNGK